MLLHCSVVVCVVKQLCVLCGSGVHCRAVLDSLLGQGCAFCIVVCVLLQCAVVCYVPRPSREAGVGV